MGSMSSHGDGGTAEGGLNEELVAAIDQDAVAQTEATEVAAQTTDEKSGTEYIDEQIEELSGTSVFFISIGSVSVGAITGVTAISETVSNGRVRVGELLLATISAGALFLSGIGFSEMKSDRLHRQRLIEIKAKALLDLESDKKSKA